MKITNTENQELRLKNKVEVFFNKAMHNKKQRGYCITRDIMATMMDKWSLFIVYNLGYYQTLRFGELKTNIRGISSRMLSVSLKKLEQHHVVKRSVYAEVPPKVEYELTEIGCKLAERMVDLNDWFLEEFIEDSDSVKKN